MFITDDIRLEDKYTLLFLGKKIIYSVIAMALWNWLYSSENNNIGKRYLEN